MKRIHILIFVLLVTGFVRGDALFTPAQDPLVVNSKSIALNSKLSRACSRGDLEPGVKERCTRIPPMSSMSSRAEGSHHSADGTVTETEFRTGDVIYREPLRHWAENIGIQHRLELVELKN